MSDFMIRGMSSCKFCGPSSGIKNLVRINTYDAVACEECMQWLEDKCSHSETCCFCAARPPVPSYIDFLDPLNTRFGG